MIIDSHIHVFDRRVAGAEENFPLWPGNEWGGDEDSLPRQMDEAVVVRLREESRARKEAGGDAPPAEHRLARIAVGRDALRDEE